MAEKTTAKIEKLSQNEEVKAVSKVDYARLEGLLSSGEELFAVKNTADMPLVIDWDLELLPSDIEGEFDKYLEKKYLEYGQEGMIGGPRIVAIFTGGKTVNFLHSFLTSKKYPVVLPRIVGKEVEYRSSFVLNVGDEVIMTKRQLASLERFEKVKKVWEDKDKTEETSWLGFLVFTPIQDGKDLLKYNISYVTSSDVTNTAREVDAQEIAKLERKEGGIVRATE
jgi:hypothetical protein